MEIGLRARAIPRGRFHPQFADYNVEMKAGIANMNHREPSLWALLVIAIALILVGGGGLAVIAWWIFQLWQMTR